MAAWIWVLIPLVVIVGGFVIEYQKNKMAMMNRSRENEEEVGDLRKLVSALKERIENLEAIAASDPDNFTAGYQEGPDATAIEEEPSIKEQNRQDVSDLASKKRRNS